MVNIDRACSLAQEYYKKTSGTGYSERILENEKYWYFCSGEANALRVGNIIISINKANGEIIEMPMPSHETIKILKSATLVKRS